MLVVLTGSLVVGAVGAEAVRSSPKKGVAGGVLPSKIGEMGVSWFYNWGYKPGYKDGVVAGGVTLNNWDAGVWQKFVPMFYGSNGGVRTETQMREICQKTSYCRRGSYYLVGNEPDVAGQDLVASDPVGAAISRQGEVIRAIRKVDPGARLIVLGLGSEQGITGGPNFVKRFIDGWKGRWGGTEIENLPDIVRGWHFHSYNTCGAGRAESYAREIDSAMMANFGKTVASQEIWVTEMGELSKAVATGKEELMRTCVQEYEGSPIVNRYAWFYAGCTETTHAYTDCAKEKWSSYTLMLPYGGGWEGGVWKPSIPYVLSRLGRVYGELPLTVSPTRVPTGGMGGSASPTPTLLPTNTRAPTPTVRPTNTPIPTPTPYQVTCYDNEYWCDLFMGRMSGGRCKIKYQCTSGPTASNSCERMQWLFCRDQGLSGGAATPTPTRAATPTPTGGASGVSSCEGTCKFGSYQCARDYANESGGKCMISPWCPGVKDDNFQSYWRWDYCYGSVRGVSSRRGDTNGDFEIDREDFEVWKEEISGGEGKRADFSGDGEVTIGDYEIWRSSFAD